MVINTNETGLGTIEPIKQFLNSGGSVAFSTFANDPERYEHIGRVLKRLNYLGII